jgi:hypothetical protein
VTILSYVCAVYDAANVLGKRAGGDWFGVASGGTAASYNESAVVI